MLLRAAHNSFQDVKLLALLRISSFE